METQLRSASREDARSVADILITSRLEYLPYAKSAHSEEGVRRWVRDVMIPSGGVVTARLDDENVGVLATSLSDGVAWIDSLYVAPGYIGQGIGTELLKHALNSLPRPIQLWTFQENLRAIRFYEHHGFQAIKYTNGEDNEEKCPDILFELS